MLDKKDLDAIEKIFDKKLDTKLDARFVKFTEELSEVLTDFTYTIDKRFSEMEAKFDKKFTDMEIKLDKKIEEQNKKLDSQDKRLNLRDKKLDFLVDCYKENLEKHAIYTDDLSRINSKLFDHDLRLTSLERKISSTVI